MAWFKTDNSSLPGDKMGSDLAPQGASQGWNDSHLEEGLNYFKFW